MRAVIQRVTESSVKVEGETVGAIGLGYMILLGIHTDDNTDDADWLVKKVCGLRVFSDGDGKMNLSIKDVQGSILLVSQFTLQASTKKGNRPSFINAAKPEKAIPLYNYVVEAFRASDVNVETGVFGADMKVSLVNNGPVTIVMDSKNKE